MNSQIQKQSRFDIAFIIIVLYLAFEFIRPQDAYSVIGIFKFPMLLTLSCLFLFIRGNKTGIFSEKPIIYIILFIIVVGLSYIKASNHYSVYKTFESLLTFLVVIIIPFQQYIKSKEKILNFFKVWIIINFIFAIFVIKNGGTGNGGFSKDENDAALVLNTALPFAFYFAISRHAMGKMKYLYWAATILIAFAVIMTFSRGGFLGLVMVALSIFAQSKHKVRTVFISLIAGSLIFALGSRYIPPEYYSDMQSIGDTEDQTRNERFYSWDIGFEMYKRNLLLGVGAGNYMWTVSHYAHYSSMYDPNAKSLGGRVAHSIYFTLLPELGTLGVIVFFGLIWQIFKRMRHIIKEYGNKEKQEPDHDFLLLAKATIVCIMTYLVTGAFISVLYYPVIWFYCAFAIGIYRVMPFSDNLNTSKKSYA